MKLGGGMAKELGDGILGRRNSRCLGIEAGQSLG